MKHTREAKVASQRVSGPAASHGIIVAMSTLLKPNLTAPSELVETLRDQGRAVLSAAGLVELIQADVGALDALRSGWNALPPDAYLRDGG